MYKSLIDQPSTNLKLNSSQPPRVQDRSQVFAHHSLPSVSTRCSVNDATKKEKKKNHVSVSATSPFATSFLRLHTIYTPFKLSVNAGFFFFCFIFCKCRWRVRHTVPWGINLKKGTVQRVLTNIHAWLGYTKHHPHTVAHTH